MVMIILGIHCTSGLTPVGLESLQSLHIVWNNHRIETDLSHKGRHCAQCSREPGLNSLEKECYPVPRDMDPLQASLQHQSAWVKAVKS